MVCDRCIKVVRDELERIDDLKLLRIDLGQVELEEPLTTIQRQIVETRLNELGFEILDDRKSRLISDIKTLIIDEIHHGQEQLKQYQNFSDFLATKIGYDYSYLNNLFAAKEGKTIGKYIVEQKIEKVKELLAYDELSLGEIAWQLDYSSTQYLSAQFKKQTGLTPSEFKKIAFQNRKPLDQV